MYDTGTSGNEGDPMEWDVPWDETQWNRETAIRTTACHCTPSEKERSRQIFINSNPQKLNSDPQKLSSNPQKHHKLKASGRAQEWLLSARQATQKAWSFSKLKNKSNHAAQPETGKSEKTRPIKITDLPPDILCLILQLVYDDEERSRDLCHCSRPRTLYKTVRNIALEHRIVNTITLRSVCRAFHAWAHDTIFRSSVHTPLEVDFSDFYRFQGKFHWMRGPEIAQKLANDFPGIAETGIVIYIGNPGRVANIKDVLSMLRGTRQNIFSGVSMWDLDYYFRDEIVELIDKVAHAIAIDLRNSGGYNPDPAAAIHLLEEVCIEDELRFVELLKHLNYRPLSKVHIPLSFLPHLFSPDKRCAIPGLADGCQTIILREFFDYHLVRQEAVWQHYKEYFLHFYDPEFPNRGDKSFHSIFEQIYPELTVKQATVLRWGKFIGTAELIEGFHITNIELRRFGIRVQRGPESSWPGVTGQDIEKLFRIFNTLQSVKIIGGKSARLPTDESGLRAGAVLKRLLPLASNLTTLVCQSTNFDLYPYNRAPYLEQMDPDHPCNLIRRFLKLETLDIEMRLCPELFRIPEHIEKAKIPRRRDWNIRINKCTGLCHSEEVPEDPQDFFITERSHAWTSPLIQMLLQNCRDWRDRHESVAGKKLSWDIKIHMIKFKVTPWETSTVRYDITFMPLAHPPMVQLKRSKYSHQLGMFCDVVEEENGSWFDKWYQEEDTGSFEGGEDDEAHSIMTESTA